MELIKDYDMRLHYQPGKANVVANALSRKSHVNTLMTGELPKELVEDPRELCLESERLCSSIGDLIYFDG